MNWETVVQCLIGVVNICVLFWNAQISEKVKKVLSSRDKEVQLIDSRLACLREDMIRFYEAFVADSVKTAANVLVAYEIIVANPLANEELRKAVYKARAFTTMAVWGQRGIEVAPDETIEASDTFQSVMDDVGLAYRKIVTAENEARLSILKSKR